MLRPDISRLNKHRFAFLQVGFLVALGLTWMAFNYTVEEPNYDDYKAEVIYQEDELQMVERTIHKEKTQPPPPVLKADEFISDDIVFDPEPEPEPVIVEPSLPVNPDPEPHPMPRYEAPPKPAPPVLPVEPTLPDEPFTIVEKMPHFAGCDEETMSGSDLKSCADQKLLKFIYSKIKYPAIARENGIEGTVFVSFIIEKDGSITVPKVVRDIGGGCGKEVLRVVNKMPNWVPGEQRGRKVRVQFNLPVKFSLQ